MQRYDMNEDGFLFSTIFTNQFKTLMILHALEYFKKILNKLIPLIARQDSHEQNQPFTVRHEPIEGLNQSFFNDATIITRKNFSLSSILGVSRIIILVAPGRLVYATEKNRRTFIIKHILKATIFSLFKANSYNLPILN